MKRALVSGATGQIGSYLVEFLAARGYSIYCLVRRSSTYNRDRLNRDLEHLHFIDGDLTDQASLIRAITEARPDEIYNLAAQSFVPTSWQQPQLTAAVTGVGVLNFLEAMRLTGSQARFYQASSSEMYGKVQETPQRETTPFYPRSPYGVAKAYGHWITVNYRESFGMYACSGICFNCESPRRGLEFVTRKISQAVARIARGMQKELRLGNLDAKRDWGFAGDYVKAMWLILQQREPTDYVIATGETYRVRDFVEIAFKHVDLDWEQYVYVDPQFYRPAEVDLLLGDPTKLVHLGWQRTVDFESLVKMMVDADLATLDASAPI